MYLQDTLGAIARRWYVVLAGLAAIAFLGNQALADVQPEYQANSQLLLLLPPTATGSDNPTSPYLNVPSGLTTAAALVAGEASTLDAVRETSERGFTASYSVSLLPGGGPFVAITAKGTDPVEVLRTRDAVMDDLNAELQRIQDEADVPDNQRIYGEVASADVRAERLHGSRARALAGIAGAGSMALLLVVAAVDRYAMWRRRRRAESGARQTGSDPTARPESAAEPADPVASGTLRR